MSAHASMNRVFRLVWNEVLGIWVAVAENCKARGKRSVRAAALMAPMLAAMGYAMPAQAGPPGPAPAATALPSGGVVAAGAATINSPGAAVLNIDQSTARAVLNWNTFNVGSAATVNFNQPDAKSATLNRVQDSNPSQILGKITAPGQVFLTNPNGVYFGRGATVDVGSLTATTHGIGDADFMAGKITLTRNGATGSVVNEGELRAALGGYIALLAPEVRNGGVVIARLGTVAMAAGEAFTLNFQGGSLASLTVQPSSIKALVENKGAVMAPGGLIVLSARALDKLQGGVVNNSGTLEATGLSMKGGRIVLEASDRVENTGTVNANAGVDGSLAGVVTITAPVIVNSGSITATAVPAIGAPANAAPANAAPAIAAPVAGGQIALQADTFRQSATGVLDVSAVAGGTVVVQAAKDIVVEGRISAAATTVGDTVSSTSAGAGGNVALVAARDIQLTNAAINSSGGTGGNIRIEAGAALPFGPSQPDAPTHAPTVALLGNTLLGNSGRRARGGSVVLTGDRVGLFDNSAIDATGTTHGGDVAIGGGFQGKDSSIDNATQVVIGTQAKVDASATGLGDGGKVVVWSDGHTSFSGAIVARGGASGGNGGFVEVSGKNSVVFTGLVDAGASHGIGGTLLLDPRDITVDAAGAAALADVNQFSDTPSADSVIAPSTITAATNAGTAVVLQANNDIVVNSSITTNNAAGVGGALTFQAGRSITLNASITSDDANVNFTVNDSGADANRAGGAAAFTNNSLIDARDGNVTITMGTKSTSGAISAGQVTAENFTITHNGPTAGAVSGAIDIGETTIDNNLTISANSARNVTNAIGSVIVRNVATIGVGAGDVTVNRASTDFNIIGLTAGNVSLNDTNAMRFAATTLSGNLTAVTHAPMGSTGAVQVAGSTNLSAIAGGFGYADPNINLSNASNHFTGPVTLSVSGTGDTGTGGYANIRDSGAVSITSSTMSTYLSVQAAGAVNLGTTTLGTDLTVNTTGAITDSGVLSVPQQTTLTAGAANNITLDSATNAFSSIRIVSGNNVTLVDTNGINFGAYYGYAGYTSTISGTLAVTAAGDISQTQYGNYDYAAISVAGAATFTANHGSSPINLYLGPNDPFGNAGNSNTFTGGVTLARNNTNTGFTNVQLRNISSSASVLSGLTNVGTLNNVYLRFDNAPSVSLPGMTLSGSLKVYAPSVLNTASTPANTISQSGAIVVAGATILAAGSSGDINLTNAGNDFSTIGLANTGARNFNLVDANAVNLFTNGYHQYVTGNMSVTTSGNITDQGNIINVPGVLTLNAGTGNVTLGAGSLLQIATLAIPSAANATIQPWSGLILNDISVAGSLNLTSRNAGYGLTQNGSTAVVTGAPAVNTTTFGNFSGGIALGNPANVLGNLAINNGGTIIIREDDAITQAAAWSTNGTNGSTASSRYNVTLTTSNDQAIKLDKAGSVFGNLSITQINSGAASAGAVHVRETGDSYYGMTEGSAWTVHGTTLIDGGAYSINLNNANNVFGPLQVLGATGLTNGLASSVTIYATTNGSADAITDVGATGAWTAGTGAGASVKLVAYDSTGTVAGGGNVILTNPANVLGDLYVKAASATITENDSITDGPSTAWFGADTGWATTGTTSLIVANPTSRSITLDNLSNRLGALAIDTTGTAGTLAGVLITDNTNLTQASAWTLGSAPVTLDARAHDIVMSTSGNVLGNVTISTINGTPTSVALTENDAITQGSVWSLTGVPVTLIAENNKTITLTSAANIMGNLTLTGGTVSLTENDSITQGGAWTTTGTTTLNATTSAITLTNANNVLGALAIGGAPSAVSITENDDITQGSAWVKGTTPFVLNAGTTHNVLLTQTTNQLGDLTVTAQNATVVEADVNGITDGNAWTIAGTTTLTAGSANPIVLNANPASDFGTVAIVSASNADIADINGVIIGASTVAGTLTVTAGGAITQSGAITAPSLRLIGTGNATLNNTSNNVATLAAGFSGGDLQFTNSGNFAVGVVSGTSGVTIGAQDVTLTSVAGTVTGLSNINASSTALTMSTGTALALPQMSIAGPQTYSASTVSGTGITIGANVTSTAAGAITFNSPVTLSADLTIQSTNSNIVFASTLAGGTNQLTVNAGTGSATFTGAVSNLGAIGDAGAALNLTSSGATFTSTLGANNGLAVTGPVVFNDGVTLANGNAATVFAGQVTLGKVGGMNFSGYDGLTFNGGVVLQNGASTITSNNSPLAFQTAGTVSGPYALTLDSGTASLAGLDRMGSNLTSLTVTALSPTIPAGGLSIAGPQTYSATNGSNIGIGGPVTSTAAGAITFNSPVLMTASGAVTSNNSAVVFASTVDGSRDLTVSSGIGTKTFTGAVGSITSLGDGIGAALILQGSGATTFADTLTARSGMTAAGNVTFNMNVTLTDGDTGSVFTGLVTTGGASGNTVSSYDGITFNGGLALTGGAVNVLSNGSTLALGGAVTGAQNLTLTALGAGAGTVTGLDNIGWGSTLTRLDLTGLTLSLPSTGLSVAGPMNITADGGIALNGAVGNASTGQIDFNSPVTLATGGITVTTGNAAVNFAGSVNGAQALTVDAGSGTTNFAGGVGATTALTSLTTDSGGTTVITGGSIRTSAAQTFNDAVVLGAATTLTGVGVYFNGTLNGAQALLVNDSGNTAFAGIVGGFTALASLTTDAAGTVSVNTGAVTTSGAQTYNENLTLGANATFTGTGVSFAGNVDGAFSLTGAAGSGALQFGGAVGGSTPLTTLVAGGNTVVMHNATTTGTQGYTAPAGVTLAGYLSTTNSNVTVTGPTTLVADSVINTGAGIGNITFSGPTSAINGVHDLTLTAGTGNVVLGGVVGGLTPLAGMHITGNDLTLPGINTLGDANQSYAALNHVTLNQSRTLGAPIAFTADSDGDGAGSFILLNGVSLTASNNTLTITAADLDLQGSSTMSSGSGLMSIIASNNRNIALGGSDAAGQLTISGSELSRLTSSTGLDLKSSGSGWIHVNGITSEQSQNITGALGLKAQGTGDVSFITATSTFNAVTTNAAGGLTNVAVNLNTTNDPIAFQTGVAVAGASTINSGGGNITFGGTVAVDNDLTLTTGNGVLTFGGAVGSNKTLTLNLGGGSVSGLGQLQTALTGLTVNSSSGITLPAFTINGPQVYNTGVITATGNLGGNGITFNNVVNVVPSSGTALAINAGIGTLAFIDLASFNANNMTLAGDEINFTKAVTGSGSLALQAYSTSRNIAVGGSGAPIVGLNLTAADMAWLPIGTLASLTIGSATGTGTLDIAGTLNAPGKPLTLNGGGGITQSGGAVSSGALTLYAAGNGINLSNASNAFGAVALNGSPTVLDLRNTLDIAQQGAAAWVLGTGATTLNAGTHDITATNSGNTFGTLALIGGEVTVIEAAATDLGASSVSKNLTVNSAGALTSSGAVVTTGNVSLTAAGAINTAAALSSGGTLGLTAGGALDIGGALSATGNVSFSSTGTVTQSAPLTIGGELSVVTSVAAGDVTLNNSGAAATSVGNTQVGGNYTLTASGDPVSQASGATLQVGGDLTITGSSIVLGGAGNLVGGTITLPATSSVEVRQAGVITLGDRNETGNLTVISERTNRSFGSTQVSGAAITLNNASNNVTGKISMIASAPTITTGADLQTGINQAANTKIAVAGTASFTAEASGAGSLGINLTNDDNHFGTLQLSGNTVDVKNAATGTTTINGALATTSLNIVTAGALTESGPIIAPALSINAAGAVTLNHTANDAGTLSVISNGNSISYIDANSLSISSIDAGGASVSLTAGAAGNLTQSAAMLNVGTLNANAGGAVTLTNGGNTINLLGTSLAGAGLQVSDSAGGLTISGNVRAVTGDLSVRTADGDFTIDAGGRLQADAGDVVAETATDNFRNLGNATSIVVGTDKRWLIYTATPDLVGTTHTEKGGLTSSFRHYGDGYATYAPGSVIKSGNGFIYSAAAPTLTVSAAINGSASHVYGNTPTGAVTYAISSGLVDSEDTTANVITGGAATYTGALSNTMNAGGYDIKYISGLTSNYALTAAATGAAYTVDKAELTYTANTATRVYGTANPVLTGGTLTGFKLGQTLGASDVTGSAAWAIIATTADHVGSYAITASGQASSNYSFVQAADNSTAFSITKAALTVTAAGDSKTYDGLDYSGGNGVSYSAFVNGEDATALGGTLAYTGTAQGARNAGTYVLSATGLTSGDYDLSYVNASLVVDKANLTLTTGPVTKTYDGTLAATSSAAATGDTQLFGADTISGGSFVFTNANAGAGSKTVNVSAVTINDGASGNNYNVTYQPNTASTIDKANISVAAGNVTKTYDGTLSAIGTASIVSGTLYQNASNGNALDALGGGSFAFTDQNAGTSNKTVTASGVAVADGNSGGNYMVGYADNTTSTINRATLTYAGNVNTREYDGTTVATLDNATLTGFVGTETVTASAGGATFADKNAGTKSVSISGIALVDGANGGLASNYSVTATSTASGTVAPKTLGVNAVVNNKVYDGNTSASLASFDLTGFVGSETVAGVFTGSATFTDKNVANGKTVAITGVNLVNGSNGGLATNYVVGANQTGTANITPATLQVAGVVALDKVYDGTLSVNMNSNSSVLTGKVGGDNVSVGSITGSFVTKDVGTAKPMVGGSFTLNGVDAGNYTLVQPSGLTASVTPRQLAVTATGVNKGYDATTAATVVLNDNRIGGDVLSLGADAAFADKSVGNGKFVGVTNIAVGGTDALNYTYNTTTATFANITQAMLTIIATGVNKVYDGGLGAFVTLSGNYLGADVLTMSYTGASFVDKNVGSGRTISVAGMNVSGADFSNYVLNYINMTTADITPKTITQVNGITAANKVYDGTTTATLATGLLGFAGLVHGDSLTAAATSAAFADKNAGLNKAVTINGLTLGGVDANNYVVAAGPMASTATITQAQLTVSATAQNKTYDATTAATATLSDNRIAGDVLAADYATATFADKNAGAGKTVTLDGITLSGADALNYAVNNAASATADIAKATLTIGATGTNKVYDATAVATVSLADDRFGGDALTLNYVAAAFADKDAGTGKTVNVSGISLSGADAGNYNVNTTAATTTADIARANLTIGATGVNKVYDGNTATTVTLADDRLGNDLVMLGYTSAVFADKNAGSAKTVTVSGLTVGGADAGNYDVSATTTTTTADIARANLAVGATAQSKVYDATTGATVSLADNRLGSDALNVDYTTAAFDSKNVGTGKAVTVGGITLSGADAGNYVANTTVSSSADVTAATISAVTGIAIATKTYDGTTAATLGSGPMGFTGMLAGDSLTASATSAAFADKGAGVNKAVTINGVALGGADAGNYILLAGPMSSIGTISQAQLTVGATAQNKTYDATTAAIASLTDNHVAGDELTLNYGAAAFADKNAGTSKTVNVGGITLSGADAGNYAVSGNATATANIAKAALAVGATGIDRTYDATTHADVTLSDNRYVGDVLTLNAGSASFADKNVGMGKTVTVGGFTLTGVDAGNYTANGSTTTTASIAKATLTIAATSIDRVYDTSTAAQVALSDNRFVGDMLTVTAGSAAFADRNAGSGKTVTVNDILLSGTDAANYEANTSTTSTGNIAKATLTVAATAPAKVYDGKTGVAVTLADNHLGSDAVTVGYGWAAFGDKNIGTGKTINVAGLSLSGFDADNYSVGDGTVTAKGDITAASLTVGAVTATKVFDGTAAAAVTLTDNRVAGDVITIASSGARYGDSVAGTGKMVTVDGIRLTGGVDAGNYLLANTSVTTQGDIAVAQSTAVDTATLQPVIAAEVVSLANVRSPVSLIDPTLPSNFGAGTGGTTAITGTTGIGSSTGTDGGTRADGSGGNDTSASDGGNGSTSASTGGAAGAGSAAGGGNGTSGIASGSTLVAAAGTGTTGNPAAESGSSIKTDGSSVGVAASGGGGGVSVALVRSASVQDSGVVTVSVPKSMVASGQGFSFPLPAELLNAARSAAVQVTLTNGMRLPSWLRYAPGTKTFVVTAAPAGSLPVQVLVRIGEQRWTVTITERSGS